MSSNSLKFASILLLSLSHTLYAKDSKDTKNSFFEDRYILKGLFYEDIQDYKKSSDIFLYLYQKTKKVEYLQAALSVAVDGNSIDNKLLMVVKDYLSHSKESKIKNKFARWLAKYYLSHNQQEQFNEIANRYLSNEDKEYILKYQYHKYLKSKDYKNAYRILQEIHKISKDPWVMLEEAKFLYYHLNQKDKAKEILKHYFETHKWIDIYTDRFFLALVKIYKQENDIDNLIKLYKELYTTKYKAKFILQHILGLYIKYHKNLDDFISFIKTLKDKKDTKHLDELLYIAYKEKRDIKNALYIADKLYKSTQDPKWLAQKAILLYEDAKANNKITPEFLKHFSNIFNKAINDGAKDSLYLNYYGYTLIDHNLNIKKGLKLVREALKQKPNSFYYLDSLAWGLYKEGKCKEAKEVMNRVEKLGGLKEDEIKEHKIIIDKCINSRKDK